MVRVALVLHVVVYLHFGTTLEASAQRSSATPVAAIVTAVDVPDLSGAKPLPLDRERTEALATFINEAMAACPVPGASVGVVQDGAVVFLEGFGVRAQGGTSAVSPDTLMRIGSATKPVTTTLAAALVDDGLVRWDTPAVDLLPGFTLSEPARANNITLANLFSASTGLPRRDLEFIFEPYHDAPAGLLAAVATLPLTAPLGERFQYSNQAFALGGYALVAAADAAEGGQVAGFEDLMRRRVLDPIGMTRSTFDLAAVLEYGDYAVPHAPDLSGSPRTLSLEMEDRFTMAVAPAGAMWSTAREMTRFLQTQLAGGVAPDGARIVSSENLRRTWQPGVAVPQNPELPPIVNAGLAYYGLGWFVGEFGGLTLINHSGGTFGFSSEVAFLPDAALGIVVLANDPLCGALLAYAVQFRLFEIVFALEPVVATELERFSQAIVAQRRLASLMLGDLDAAAVAPILGSYTNPDLGEITLSLRENALMIDAGEISSRMAPLRGLPGESVRYRALDPPLAAAPGWFTFEPGPDGSLQPILTVELVPGDPPLVYAFTPLARGDERIDSPA